MRMSQDIASSHPPPRAKPLTAAIVGFSNASISSKSALHLAVERRCAGCILQLGDVRSGDESLLAGAGDGDDTDLVVVAQHRQRGAEVCQHLPAQRVAHLGPADGEDGEPVGHLDGQRLVEGS